MRRRYWLVCVAAIVLLALASSRLAEAAAPPCERACLDGIVDQYLAALVAHDPAKAPLAKKVKFTENGQALALGDGLWGTASGLGSYKLRIADPEQASAGLIGVVQEHGRPVILALRLKVKKGLITEIESIVSRETFGALGGPGDAGAGAALESQGKPKDIFLANVEPSARSARHDMIATANSYFSALQRNNLAITVPFDPQCNRQENGIQTTNNPKLDGLSSAGRAMKLFSMGCAEQFKSGFFTFVTEIRDRRFAVVDEERGLVFAFGFFDHSGAATTVTLPDGRVFPSPALAPLTFQIAELFKIEGGKIKQIEAALNRVPYHMDSGWAD